MPTWKDLEHRHGELRALRAREEPAWRDLSYALEEDGDGGSFDVRSERRPDGFDSFDSAPLYAKDDFVGGLFTEAINPAERWFELGIEDKDLQQWGPVKQHLWDRAAVHFASLDPAVSNFYLQAPAWFADLASFGPGFMAQEEMVGQGKIIDRALPIREMFKDVDANGDSDTYHREFMLTGRQAKGKWGPRAPTMRDDEKALFVHALYPNPDYVPGRLGPRGMPWTSCFASPDKRDFSAEGGYFELPIHEIQWKQRSGRPWPSGPGHKARADINMLNEVQRSGLTALQFEAEPMWLVHDENIMTAADIYPSAIIGGSLSEQGKPLAQPMPRGENLQLQQTERTELRNAIREAFYFSLFQLINRPQMTATEFSGWKTEKLKLLAPHLVCIHRGLAGYIARRDGILLRAGAFARIPAPPELQGNAIRVKFISPFAQAQKATKAQSAMQIGNAAVALAPVFPQVADNVDGDNLMRAIVDGLSGDPAFIIDPRAVQNTRQQRAQQLAEQQATEQAAQKASIIADVAHAGQAMTLSRLRGGKTAA